MKTFFPFYCFATRSVLAPEVYYIHMYGYRLPQAKAGRVLDRDLSVEEAVKRYGPVTGINL